MATRHLELHVPDRGAAEILGVFSLRFFLHELISSKDSSHHLQLNCIIIYFFKLNLMLHACVKKFNMTGNLEKF